MDVLKNAEEMQVWLYDLTRDTFAPFTFEGVNRHPVWTPDARRIVFMADREGPVQLFWQLADGSGGLERLLTNPAPNLYPLPYSWSLDGQLLTFVYLGPTTGTEFWVLRMGGASAGRSLPSSEQAGQDRKAERFFQLHTWDDGGPQLSPDGHWLAYASGESGRREIYVQPYPGLGGKWQISTDGGNEPMWDHEGRELFYRSGDKMMAVDIRTQPTFVAGKPRQLFEGHYLHTWSWWVRANHDVSPDGQRFLMLKPVTQEQGAPTQINVVLNWTEELKRLVPPGK